MEIIISNNYEETSEKATDLIEALMKNKLKPLICVASGDSPAGIYKNFVARVNKNELDISQWQFLGLDEWVGLNGKDEGSCRYHLNAQLFNPLKIPNDKIHFFDGASHDLEQQCWITEAAIQKHEGIEVAILGLGLNGHIGMNEPNTSISTRSHIINLDPLTAQVGQKYFKTPQVLSKGITLGIASLLEAKNIILIVSGEKKAAIIKEVIEGAITENVPASILRNHPNCYLFLDKAAASLLE